MIKSMQRGDGDDMSRDDGDVMHRGDDDKEITNCSTGDSMPDGKQYLYSYEGSEITSLNWARFTAEQHERNILPVKKKKGATLHSWKSYCWENYWNYTHKHF